MRTARAALPCGEGALASGVRLKRENHVAGSGVEQIHLRAEAK